ncbi:GNAT family N-acetyltransferase [Patulibacter sp.]|uniref:GNAT family N-acetyltransferase n=1 Tax=Patulibacter sp. TaxID=1912859 RepID=UPI0027161AAB|nr:GNAT family N-acetyltransferase [Patulibacter sp.]MDO9409791.1 GNAT family N-acetyltransferase [Patulibacter sp.]
MARTPPPQPGPGVVFRVERADAEPGATLLREFLAELEERYGPAPADAPAGPTATPDELAPPHGTFLVGRLGDEPVACGGCKRLFGEDHPNGPTAEVKRMYVRPSGRGRGVARALLAELERAAVRAGHRRVRLDTGAAQPDARHVYLTSGYREIPDYNGNPRAAFWFEKELRR